MYTLALWVATAAVGIDVGWQRLPEGGMQYIIQLDPHTLEHTIEACRRRGDRERHSTPRGRNPLVSHHRGHRTPAAG